MVGALLIGVLGAGIVLTSPAVQAAGSGSVGAPPRLFPIPAPGAAPTGPRPATIRPFIPTTITFTFVTAGAISENTSYGGIAANFTDSAHPVPVSSDYNASIDWGDGTPVYTTALGNVTVNCGSPAPAGSCNLDVAVHSWADEGIYTVTATVSQVATPTDSATGTGTLTAGESDVLTGTASPVSGPEGTSLSGIQTASFADTSTTNTASDFIATINWGDGTTSAGTVTEAVAGTFKVTGSHIYADEGSYTVTTTLSDDAPGTNTATTTSMASITEADVLTGTASPVSGPEGTSLSGIQTASFADTSTTNAASDFIATINWGDGTTSTGTVTEAVAGTFKVTGSHIYADEGSYTVTTTLSDDAPGTNTATATSMASISDADVLTGTGTDNSVTGSTELSGVQTASFTDTYANSSVFDFTATINWGDGTTSTGTVTQPAGAGTPFLVTGSHTYALFGSYTVATTLSDDAPGTATATATSTADVIAVGLEAPTTTSVSSSANPSSPGEPVTFTAVVGFPNVSIGTPTGSVTFFDGTTPIPGCINLLIGGSAPFTVTCSVIYGAPNSSSRLISGRNPSAVSTHSITATYGGSSLYRPSTSPALIQTVLSPGPAATGGYWLVASDGGIFAFGDAGFFGSTGALTLNKPVVGIASTPDGKGYWLVASDGGIFGFGDAGFFGSTGAQTLNKPVVGIASTPDGKGYWLVASDGGIFGFGDAGFFGSTGALTLNKPVVGIASTPDGKGYWLVASDGGIFGFGDAGFFGSTGAQTLNKPVVGIASTPDGKGYWLVASDGGIFGFGDAGFFGSTGAQPLNKPVVGIASTPDGKGYWLVASDGGIFGFGDAGFFGSTGALTLNKPVVGMTG